MTDQPTKINKNYVDGEVYTLKEHFEGKIKKLWEQIERESKNLKETTSNQSSRIETVINSKLEAFSEAVRVALVANEKRLDALNEIKGIMADKDKLYATRVDTDAIKVVMKMEFDRIYKEIESLKLSRAELVGKADQSQVNVSMFLSLSALIMGVITLLLKLFGN